MSNTANISSIDTAIVGHCVASLGCWSRKIDPEPANPIAEAFKAIRKLRRMSAAEVARAMGLPPRTYEHLEAGTAKISYERVVDFAEATDSDPIAILATHSVRSPHFAIHCADNKLMTIMMIAMMELNDELGADITYLDAQTLVGGFTRLTRDLAQHVRRRETFAEQWLKEGSGKLAAARSPGLRRLRPISGKT